MKKLIIFTLIFILICTNVYAEDIGTFSIGERIVTEAANWLGTPYGQSDGSEGYGSEVDCSGLVMQVFNAFGVSLPRTSALQAMEGEKIPLDEMIAGDIVCFIYEDGSIGHVGIFVGGNTMIHSPRPEKSVEFSSYFEDWGSIKAVYGRRIEVDSDYIPNEPNEEDAQKLLEYLSMPNNVKTDHLQNIEIEDDNNIVFIDESRTVVLQIGNPIMLVNGEEKPIDASGDASPFIAYDRTHLPLRKVAEEFGAQVNWIGGENGEINLKYRENEITLWLNSEHAIANGSDMYLDTSPIAVNGRTYLPIRFIADQFGWDLDWDSDKKTVTISANNYSVLVTD